MVDLAYKDKRLAELDWEKTCKLIPDGVQTLSKMPSRQIEGLYPLYIDRAQGAHVFSDSRKYIDYPCGLGAILLGYHYRPVDDAIIKQLAKGVLYSLPSRLETKLAEKIVELIPCAEQVRFLKTGSEATSAAVKIARAVTGKEGVVCCYDDQTEILTKDGFKYFKDIGIDEIVATLNPKGHNLEYQPIERKLEFSYSGKMIHFTGKQLDLMVTPKHKIYKRMPRPSEMESYKLVDAVNMLGRKTITQMTAECEWNCCNAETVTIPKLPLGPKSRRKPFAHTAHKTKGITQFPIDVFVKFMGWYLSEGSCVHQKRGKYEVSISQSPKNKVKVNEICNIIRQLGFEPNIHGHHINFSSKEMVLYLKQFGSSKDKFVPYWIKQLPPRKLKMFAEAMVKGDGAYEDGKMRKYYSVSKQLIDDMQEICLKMGCAGTVFKVNHNGFNGSEVYHLTITNGSLASCRRSGWAKKIDYNGNVYCVTVPNHIVLVRRNGKVVWSGNSGYHGWHDWYMAATDKKKGIPKIYRKLSGQVEYNDFEKIKEMFSLANVIEREVGAIIMEPYIYDEPQNDFLRRVVDFAHNQNALVIFDEVVTGFRTTGYSAQKMFNVTPDLACLGKAMANGLPISVVCGKKDYMKELQGNCFVSSTFGGELLSIAAALATIKTLERENVIGHIWEVGQKLKDGFNEFTEDLVDTQCVGYPCRTFFEFPTEMHKSLLWQECIKKGILFGYAQFISFSHTDSMIYETLDVLEDAIEVIRKNYDEPQNALDENVKPAQGVQLRRKVKR